MWRLSIQFAQQSHSRRFSVKLEHQISHPSIEAIADAQRQGATEKVEAGGKGGWLIAVLLGLVALWSQSAEVLRSGGCHDGQSTEGSRAGSISSHSMPAFPSLACRQASELRKHNEEMEARDVALGFGLSHLAA